MSTETIKTIRDGEPRTAVSTFTQLLSSEILTFKLNGFYFFTSTETIRTIRDGRLDFHTAPELGNTHVQVKLVLFFYVHRDHKNY